MDASQLSQLEAAAGDNRARLARWVKRLELGEPVAYILGEIMFRGLSIKMDRRAFITDAELTYLIDVLVERIDHFTRHDGRPPRVVEFGVGGGSLSIALKNERPKTLLTGLDLDGGALELAKENVRAHSLDIRLLESDFFQAWPDGETGPDFVFADPPWGTESDLYDTVRDAAHYHNMPPLSAFPAEGGRTGLHRRLIDEVANMHWNTTALLNLGNLPDEEVESLRIHAAPHGAVSVLDLKVVRILEVVYH
ncbi:MAG: methyltransferase [Opitutales bacterium]|nr:methyltransferase [Opitutales bacterium]NRA28143.1 methyltransferase [Opitutales bacterium]